MYGSRARFGLITPSVNTTTAPEFRSRLPDETSLHSSRVWLQSGTKDELDAMLEGVDSSSELLATADVDVIVFGCTSGSFFRGDEIEDRIFERSGVPAITTAMSLRRGLDALDATKITITTPYTDALNKYEREFMTECGYDVVEMDGLGIEDGLEMGNLSPERAYRQAVETARPEADVHVISCANYRTFEIIEQLEADIAQPVLTSNQVVFWDAIRMLGLDASSVSLGSLFDR
jgi:maleate isomerase